MVSTIERFHCSSQHCSIARKIYTLHIESVSENSFVEQVCNVTVTDTQNPLPCPMYFSYNNYNTYNYYNTVIIAGSYILIMYFNMTAKSQLTMHVSLFES